MRFLPSLLVLASGAVFIFSGCPRSEELSDASSTLDTLASEDIPPAHVFLAVPNTAACEPHVCQVDGNPYAEFKAWNSANESCVGAPQDLICRVKSQFQGVDWPEDAKAQIEAASVEAGGFTESQKAALRCLAYMEPSQGFKVYANVAGSGSPGSLVLGLSLDLPGNADEVADEFLARLGPYLGTAYGVSSDFGLETKITSYSGYPGASGGVNIRVNAVSYKGIPLRNDNYFDTSLQPTTDTGPNGEQACTGHYRMSDSTNGFFDRRLKNVRVDEEGRVSIEIAVQNALDSCGATCWALPDAKIKTYLTSEGLLLELQLGCPSHCKTSPDWTCTYTVDAFTGNVLGGQEDCCVDCIE